MITIGIYDDLAAADDHVKHDLVGPGMARKHRFEAVRKAGVPARDAHVHELATGDGHALGVVPQPCHIGGDRRRLDLSLDLRIGRGHDRTARARAPRPRVDLALHHHDFVGLEQKPRLLEHARKEDDVDRAGEVLERGVSHDLALPRDHAAHLPHEPRHADLGVLEGARHLNRLRVRQLGQLC